ncbi:serine/threonine protein kinase [Palleronia aestuarii]|uniref:Serine/threonine protein kinase n=1 Tax=Palleronia aestuarii TaxID=568105 RepID=A0A2W7MQI2_9RHOB|nr:bifunctional protein-serine/threonine kinase/phosphatase [Palleronia aestuarii]PZX10118.1 serine/threonine protein kinase [Palleronia aestuarii]
MSRDMTQPDELSVVSGRYTSAGRKAGNQDAVGAAVPDRRALALKGAAFALADGISTSPVAQDAAEAAVTGFLNDYYSTSDAWSVRTSAARVISASNAWLHGQGRRIGAQDRDRGYVCTFAALVLKGRAAHLFHVGDSRIWRLSGDTLEPMTEDHRIHVSEGRSYLARALGADRSVEIDHRAVDIAAGDVFVMTTDGVHDWIDPRTAAALIAGTTDLDDTARRIAREALDGGSDDNLTVQIVRVNTVADADGGALFDGAAHLPVPPLPVPGAVIDGLRILRAVHATSRSHVFLAAAPDGRRLAMKIPSIETAADPAAMQRFLMEEWIARRIDSPHVLRAADAPQPRTALYVLTDWIEGRSLRQWLRDTPDPDLEPVRDIVGQIVTGLRAFHRREMMHQDLRPENVMIDTDGTLRIIDFGSVWVAGVAEAAPAGAVGAALGTWQYTAPEYLTGDAVSWRSDLYALGTIAYEMLTGHLPYGTAAARVRSRREAARLQYRPADAAPKSRVPAWMDAALRRAVHPDPLRRHDALSEFVAELRAPTARTRPRGHRPLIERHPVRFWQGVSALLALCLALSLVISSP